MKKSASKHTANHKSAVRANKRPIMRGATIPILAMSAVTILVISLYVSQAISTAENGQSKVVQLSEGFRYKPPQAFQIPHLNTTENKPLRREDFKDKWTLVNFGYLSCPDICPIHLAAIHKVSNGLDLQGVPLQVLFVTMDPDRDNIDRLKEYLPFFDPEYIGVSGNLEDLQIFGKALGTTFRLQDIDVNGNYIVVHNSVLSLINPDGLVAGQLPGLLDEKRLTLFLGQIIDKT